MFGKNKILKPENHDGNYLDVVEIFPTLQGEGPYVGYPSVFVRLGGCNLACEFCDTEFENFKKILLAEILSEVKKLAKNEKGDVVRKLVVITGGEPFRQPIERLCEELVKLNFLVQIETNGTLFREISKEVKIICSPKISNGKYHKIREDLLERIDAFKFIVSFSDDFISCHPERSEGSQEVNEIIKQIHDDDKTHEILRFAQDDKEGADDGKKEIQNNRKKQNYYFDIAEVGQSKFDIPVYVQPMDEYDEVKNENNLRRAIDLCEKRGYFLSMQMHKIIGLK